MFEDVRKKEDMFEDVFWVLLGIGCLVLFDDLLGYVCFFGSSVVILGRFCSGLLSVGLVFVVFVRRT